MSGVLDQRTREAIVSAVLLFALCLAVIGLMRTTGLISDRLLQLGVVNIIAGLSLGLFCGGTGILSLAHIAFFGIGGYVSAWFTLPSALKPILLPDMPAFVQNAEWSLWAALLPAIAATALIGALTGGVIKRLRDTAAVIASLGFLIIAYLLFIGLKPLTNGKQSLYGIPIDLAGWPVALTALAATLVFCFAIKSSRTGRAAEALRDDEAAARSVGVRPEPVIFGLWVGSAVGMGVAGALFVHTIGVASPNTFYLDKTFALIVLIIVGGYRSLTGCVIGAIVITGAEEAFRKTEEALGTLAGTEVFGLFEMPRVFGLTALCFSLTILLVLYWRPDGIAGYREVATVSAVRSVLGRWLQRAVPSLPSVAYDVGARASLRAQGLSKRYGAFTALDGVELDVGRGTILGLIGPNGAGKSTFINVVTGSLFASGGQLHLGEADVTLWSADRLAREGLGRTFQNIRLFDSLSSVENVQVAVAVAHPELSRAEIESRALAWLAELDLADKAWEIAGALAYGDQRRLEIARALALEPQFLLLDEPAAGMNPQETERLKSVLRDVVQRIGCGVILVEHDMPMVMSLCDELVVLNKGEQIARGDTATVRTDRNVIEAYIGEDASSLA
ncbi:MAG: branched-chain amino acid ABC transporter ATP-binding protein/permease [Pseudomonadota bacterium]